MLQRESSRNMSILLHNLSSVITSLKTLKPNIIHRTDHAHIFQNAPKVSFILLVFSPWSRIQLWFTQCLCLLYLFSLTQCTKYDSPHHHFHLSSWWMNPLSLGQLFCRMSHILDLSDICLTVLPKSVWILSLSKKWAEALVGGLIILCPFCLQDPVTEYFKIHNTTQLLHSSLWC